MVKRNAARLRRLEDRSVVRRERREERDERGEGTAAVMVAVRSGPGGRAVEEGLAGRLREHGGDVAAVLGAGGREAISAYRDLFFNAVERARNEDVNEQGGSQ